MYITNTSGVSRPYRLVTFNRHGHMLSEESYSSLADLAYAAHRKSWSVEPTATNWFGSSSQAVMQQAYGPRGALISMTELQAFGRRVSSIKMPRWWQTPAGYVRRNGPVPGIRKWRGGSYFQSVQSQNERRTNCGVFEEEGEVPARASRRWTNLPDSWDDKQRNRERCWKAQHKGCKSWDRPAPHGAAK